MTIPRDAKGFNRAVRKMNEKELKDMLSTESKHWYLTRVFQRYNKLRAKRELSELLKRE